MTPYEALTGFKPNVSTFGCVVYAERRAKETLARNVF